MVMPFMNIESHSNCFIEKDCDFVMNDLNFFISIGCGCIWVAGVSYVIRLTYKFVTEYAHVTVNCWFCNKNSRVPFKHRRTWTCPSCDQFNGFNDEGDYIRPIPEQYNVHLNTQSRSSWRKKIKVPSANGLCRLCNAYQGLKIQQIAAYVPLRESNYDQEIELFKKKLEKSYKLCSVCERTVENTLNLKSSLYAPKISEECVNYLKSNLTITRQSFYSHWFMVLILILTTSAAIMFICLNDTTVLDHFNKTDYSFVVNIISLCLSTCMSRSLIGKYTLVVILLSAVLVFWTSGFAASITKVLFIIFVIIFFIYNNLSNTAMIKNIRSLSIEEKLSELEFETVKKVKQQQFSPSNPTHKKPLRLNFSPSDMFRGPRAISDKSSYLFKKSHSLLEPSKLVVDDLNLSTESAPLSPTISCGYETVPSYLPHSPEITNVSNSPDSVTEFDSASQISIGRSSKRRFMSKNNVNSGFESRHFCIPENDEFYRESSVGSSPNYSFSPCNSSNPQVSTFFLSMQIVLSSLAFFTLGFSLQLIVNQFKS